MAKEYVHHPLGEEVEAISGSYVLEREDRITVDEKEILYAVGYAVVDSSCCGQGGCGYAVVPGIIREWKSRTNQDNLPVSQIEPLNDSELREKVKKLIRQVEKIEQVNFL